MNEKIIKESIFVGNDSAIFITTVMEIPGPAIRMYPYVTRVEEINDISGETIELYRKSRISEDEALEDHKEYSNAYTKE